MKWIVGSINYLKILLKFAYNFGSCIHMLAFDVPFIWGFIALFE